MQVIVLGMHRSGTSVVARTLNLVGCHLGADLEVHWERPDVIAVNDAILAACQGNWQYVGPHAIRRLARQGDTALDARLRALLATLDAHRPWAVKDPRLCMTLPVWQRHLEWGVYVLCYRHPIEVAMSLETRDKLPLPVGCAMWELHMRSALRATQGAPRVLVRYQDCLGEPEATADRLVQELGASGVDGLDLTRADEIVSYMDRGQWHERVDHAKALAVLTEPQMTLAHALDRGELPEQREGPLVSAQALELLAQSAQLQSLLFRYRQLNEAFNGKLQALVEAHNAQLRQLIDEHNRALETVRARMESAGAADGAADVREAIDAAKLSPDAHPHLWAVQRRPPSHAG